METVVQKSEIIRCLRLAQNIADRKSTMPMLAKVLVTAEGPNALRIDATDLNVSLKATVPAANKADGAVAVGAKELHDVVSSLPDGDVHLKQGDNNWIALRGGKTRCKLVGLSAREYPTLPAVDEGALVEVETAAMRDLIDKTLFSACTDETRFHLNGVCFEPGGSVARMCATDGHRLARVTRSLDFPDPKVGSIIIPSKGAGEMRKVLELAGERCGLHVKAPFLFLRGAELVVAVKLIESEFPPADQVIPQSSSLKALVNRIPFLEAVRRAKLLSTTNRGITMAFTPKGGIVVGGDNPDAGEIRDEVEATIEGEGEVTTGMNPKYMEDLLAHMETERVEVGLTEPLAPILVTPEDDLSYTGVVMPMRV